MAKKTAAQKARQDRFEWIEAKACAAASQCVGNAQPCDTVYIGGSLDRQPFGSFLENAEEKEVYWTAFDNRVQATYDSWPSADRSGCFKLARRSA